MKLINLCANARWDTTKNASRASSVALTHMQQDDDQFVAEAHGSKATHRMVITLSESGGVLAVSATDCSCQDFRMRGLAIQTLCKHLIALGNLIEVHNIDVPAVALGQQRRQIVAGVQAPTSLSPAPKPPESPVVLTHSPITEELPEPPDFKAKVAQRVGRAIQKIAEQALAVIQDGRVPYLIGPSGCGKTSAGEAVALKQGWKLFEIYGTDSWTDAEIIGIDGAGMYKPGILTRAAKSVREGSETALVLISEVPRFNSKAINVLMNPLLPKSVEVAHSMGIQTDEPIRHFEGPFWGQEWAPAARMHFCLDGNPWGSLVDPAIRQRVVPVEVDFANDVAACFSEAIREAVLASWEWVRVGKADVVIDYRELTSATGPDDLSVVRHYLARLRMKDKTAASAFLKLHPQVSESHS